MRATLLFAGLSTLLVAATYGYVAWSLYRKSAGSSPASRTLRLFSLWWGATSLNQALGSLLYLAAAFGTMDTGLQASYVLLQRLLLAVSLVGLMQYLVYLQTGRDALTGLAVVYGVYWATQVYHVVARQPVGVEAFSWRTDLVYAKTLSPAWDLLTPLFIVLPPVVGALLLLRIYRRVETPTQRFRILAIAVGFTVWWLVAVAAGHPATHDIAWFQAVNRVVGVLVALAVLLAYEPTGWMKRRYQLEPYQAQG